VVKAKEDYLQMKGNYGLKLLLVFTLIAVMTYICFAGSLFGLVKIPGVNDIVPGIDINGGIDAMLYAVTEGDQKPTQADLDTAKIIIEKRLDKVGILDRNVTTDVNAGRVIVQIPWAPGETDFNPDKTLEMIGETALLTFQEVEREQTDESGNPLPTNRKVLEGTDVVNAFPVYNEQTKSYEVVLELNDRGREAFAEATKRLMNEPIAIFMDDQFISAPIVQAHITDGRAVITLPRRENNREALTEAKDLADTIRAGALPFRMEARHVNAISPLLGKGALDITIRAFIIAFLLICMFMILYYRLPGLIASIALFMLAIMTLNIVSWLRITLTLPGLAGIVLSVGMGVDANVIIFERIREELRSGKTIKAAIDLGFKRAFSAIFDGNMTTVIVAVILLIYGTGAMISFAYTLIVGVILSFFTALMLTRTLLDSVSEIDIARRTWLFGIREV
jgi:preprotein translocase subunit SecD